MHSTDNTTPQPGAARRTGVVVPANADSNPGDRALVWEAVEFLRDARLVDEVVLLNPSDEPDIPDAQAQPDGCRWITALLRPPRRGRNKDCDKLRDGAWSLLNMLFWAALDFVRGEMLILLAPWPKLARLVLGPDQLPAYEAFYQAEIVAVKGGGFLHADGSFRTPYYIWWMLFYFKLALRLGKPLIILPNSFGPFNGPGVRWQMRRVLSRCSFISARESFSATMLEDLLGRTVPVFPDHGYYLKPAPREVGERVCREAGVPLGEQPCVGFTLRPHRFHGAANPQAAYSQYLDAMAELAREVSRRGYHPILITQTRGPSAHENDRLAIEEVHQRLGDVPHTWVDYAGNCREMQAIYGCLDFLVGT
ncbi:MAG: polysaccharide pyruvyl transferase family protein, partial [Armatimonadota bacterium]